MDFTLTEWTGFAAGLLTTIAFVPQVWKTWRTKSAKDLSLGMTSLFAAGVALWLIYGFLLNEPPIIFWNVITMVLASLLLVFKLKFK